MTTAKEMRQLMETMELDSNNSNIEHNARSYNIPYEVMEKLMKNLQNDEDVHALIYQWIKQGHIGLKTFKNIQQWWYEVGDWV